jgi:hypothetical protein
MASLGSDQLLRRFGQDDVANAGEGEGAKRNPGLARELRKAQAEAGPLMPIMMRRADMAAL